MRRYSLSLAIALLGFAAMHPAEAGLRPADPPRPGLVEKVLLLCPLGYRFDPTFRRCVRSSGALFFCRGVRARFDPRCRHRF